MTDSVEIVDAEAPSAEPEKVEAEETPERPAWLPAQFDNGEALASSYKSAPKKITEQGQENRALRDEIENVALDASTD